MFHGSFASRSIRGFEFKVYDSNHPLCLSTAEGIAHLFSTEYCGKARDPWILNPEIMVSEVRNGNVISFVLLNCSGEPVAHAGIIKDQVGGYISLGRLLITSSLRQQGLGRFLTEVRIQSAETSLSEGCFIGLHSEVLLSAKAAMHLLMSRGFCVGGHSKRKYPDYNQTGHLDGSVSLYRIENPVVRGIRKIYVCSTLASQTLAVFKRLGCEREVVKRKGHERSTRFYLHQSIVDGIPHLQVCPNSNGETIPSFNRYRLNRSYVYVCLPLSCRSTVQHSAYLNSLGFNLAGVKVGKTEDELLLQLSGAHDLDFSKSGKRLLRGYEPLGAGGFALCLDREVISDR